MNKKSRIALSIAIAFLSLTTFYIARKITHEEDTSKENAEVFFVKGMAQIRKYHERDWQDIEKDTNIQDGDTISTYDDGIVEIKFGKNGKNYLKVSSDTIIKLERIEPEGNKHIVLRKGRVTTLIENLSQRSKFRIKTPQAICGVLGTGFDTETTFDTCTVKVYEGEVGIKGISRLGFPMGDTLTVPSGNKINMRKYKIPEDYSDLTHEEINEWRQWKQDIDTHLFKGFVVYADKDDPRNHYIPSGWVGDYDAIRREESTNNPHSGNTCLKFVYTAKTPQGAGWAGVYWQNPVNNWGEIKGGFNLKGARKLTFWARGEIGNEIINRFGIGGISGSFPDSATKEIGPIHLTNEWRLYNINTAGSDLSHISGGFYWMTDKASSPDGIVFYLDDIAYE